MSYLHFPDSFKYHRTKTNSQVIQYKIIHSNRIPMVAVLKNYNKYEPFLLGRIKTVCLLTFKETQRFLPSKNIIRNQQFLQSRTKSRMSLHTKKKCCKYASLGVQTDATIAAPLGVKSCT